MVFKLNWNPRITALLDILKCSTMDLFTTVSWCLKQYEKSSLLHILKVVIMTEKVGIILIIYVNINYFYVIIVEKVYILIITCLCSYVFFLQWRFLHSLAHESPKKEFNCLIKQIKITIIQRVPIHVHIRKKLDPYISHWFTTMR